ncbi:hypothetical protein DL89DRAFT_257085 [Linderina pennispora]|uniref:Uncharacterized protein n=1 Tax=Linderina pennispora TaxID=61395 RepID=A0A1Y1WBU9_9FUNG|nr:uncharacterized protein DL89DRAFT_257085 [Linderina pennispora]ORX70912.1 hypothetical protein DL89DRAFT_257085 [Linderina pennispora]
MAIFLLLVVLVVLVVLVMLMLVLVLLISGRSCSSQDLAAQWPAENPVPAAPDAPAADDKDAFSVSPKEAAPVAEQWPELQQAGSGSAVMFDDSKFDNSHSPLQIVQEAKAAETPAADTPAADKEAFASASASADVTRAETSSQHSSDDDNGEQAFRVKFSIRSDTIKDNPDESKAALNRVATMLRGAPTIRRRGRRDVRTMYVAPTEEQSMKDAIEAEAKETQDPFAAEAKEEAEEPKEEVKEEEIKDGSQG